MKLRVALAAFAVALTTMVIVSPAGAQTTVAGVTLPGTTCALSGTLGTGACDVVLTGFQVVNGQVSPVFNIVQNGNVLTTVTAPLNGLLATANGTCTILDLTIGRIQLDLLGLVVDTHAPIHLTITAQSGPGNLLGNLLCGVAHLLDNPSGQLAGVVNLLNNLLRQGGILTAV